MEIPVSEKEESFIVNETPEKPELKDISFSEKDQSFPVERPTITSSELPVLFKVSLSENDHDEIFV